MTGNLLLMPVSRFRYSSVSLTSYGTAALKVLGARGILLTKHPEHVPPGIPTLGRSGDIAVSYKHSPPMSQSSPRGVAHFAFARLEALLPECRAVVYNGGVVVQAEFV